jgi:hypothetical protein
MLLKAAFNVPTPKADDEITDYMNSNKWTESLKYGLH